MFLTCWFLLPFVWDYLFITDFGCNFKKMEGERCSLPVVAFWFTKESKGILPDGAKIDIPLRRIKIAFENEDYEVDFYSECLFYKFSFKRFLFFPTLEFNYFIFNGDKNSDSFLVSTANLAFFICYIYRIKNTGISASVGISYPIGQKYLLGNRTKNISGLKSPIIRIGLGARR